MPDYEILDFAKMELTLPDKIDPADEMSWQHYLYSKLGNKRDPTDKSVTQIDDVVDRIVAMAKVLYGLHMVTILYLILIFFFFSIHYILLSPKVS